MSHQIADPKGFRATQHEKLAIRAGDAETQAKKFEEIESVRKSDPDALTILTWWARRKSWVQGEKLGPYKRTEKLPEQCGGCYWTNDRDQEFTADSIVIDNTRFITSNAGKNLNNSGLTPFIFRPTHSGFRRSHISVH